MEKYYFENFMGRCFEKCMVKNDGVKIGSVKCQECEHCNGISREEKWIKCDRLDEALKSF
jgi:hypothetical protein